MKKTAAFIMASVLTLGSVSCLAEEKANDCPAVTINGVEFYIGMSYEECINALAETGMTDVEDMHIPALRIGVQAYDLEVDTKWIEGSANFYGPIEMNFVVAMPDGLDSDDSDGAVAAVEEGGRLFEITYKSAEAEEFNLSEFTIDGQGITSETTEQEMSVFAQDRGLLLESNDNHLTCGLMDEKYDVVAYTVDCWFKEENTNGLKNLAYTVEPEYFMAMYY